ncbi:MAG: DNA polymerase IV [Hyphomonadaceae bacterium JAD_PAG50586_4]|nr:MAG: DNA polymerase IV [Hyphomonadaceae bacterium JAD_PAG50586_4]
MILCRACASETPTLRCAKCGEDRSVEHAELTQLSIAHLDCDAFYASIEKRDDPSLEPHPVIVGGGKRGVVSTCCYVARAYGVRSAMPMFQALKLCPQAKVVHGEMRKYVEEGRVIRRMMEDLTPQVQPLSIDEAFMDLSGTEALHGGLPAQSLIKLQNRIWDERRLTVSVGLSFNKFLAKTASDLDKPRGFSVIGRGEALAFLESRSVSTLPGVGPAGATALERNGLKRSATSVSSARNACARFTAIGARICSPSRWPTIRASSIRTANAKASPPKPRSSRTFQISKRWKTCSGRSARRSPPVAAPPKPLAAR